MRHLRNTVAFFVVVALGACAPTSVGDGQPDPPESGPTGGGSTGGAGDDVVAGDPGGGTSVPGGNPAVSVATCPEGSTPVYHSPGDDGSGSGYDPSSDPYYDPYSDPYYDPYADPSSYFDYAVSGVSQGDGGAAMTVTCEAAGTCGAGQVGVEFFGTVSCVAAPGACAPGTTPSYVPPLEGDFYVLEGLSEAEGGFDYAAEGQGGFWKCQGPCEIEVQYGALFGGISVCADTSPAELGPCAPGMVPTFMAETQEWACDVMCDGGLYDPVYLDESDPSTLVCVPC